MTLPEDGPGSAAALYDEEYARQYEAWYLHPWMRKHELNVRNLTGLLSARPGGRGRWLDLACGQGWHFAQVGPAMDKVGVDLSAAQLRAARRRNPGAHFVCADIGEVGFRDGAFDLVTSFWAGYCYLDSGARIEALVRRAAAWTRTGGAIYFEVLTPEDVGTFNRSRYAARTGFRVSARQPDYSQWSYRDAGGRHDMTSPPVALFVGILGAHFADVEARHDGGFMVHVIARDRRADGGG